MPTPLEILLDPVSLIVLTMYAGLITWEWLAPGRSLPVIKYWRVRGLTTFAVFFYLSTYLPLWWDQYLASYQLFNLTDLGTLAGVVVGLLTYELGAYWWHRSSILWRLFHQMHHSAERLDTFGTFWFSPMDMIGWTLLGSLCMVLVIGITPQAATILLLCITFIAMFQHANVRTPRWVGILIQRPESHTIHHGKNIHRYNYADLPVLDMLFGTFRNPREFEVETGFYPGASAHIVDMLLCKDLNRTSNNSQPAVAST